MHSIDDDIQEWRHALADVARHWGKDAVQSVLAALNDEAERAYLNELPTSFVLENQAVDRLRAAAGRIITDSPDFQRLLRDVGAKIVEAPKPAP